MKTISSREAIFTEKAHRVLNGVSMYRAIYQKQIELLYHLSDELTKRIISELKKQRRIVTGENGLVAVSGAQIEALSQCTLKALWVLCDFSQQILYHTIGEYPVTASFVTEKKEYDVICVPSGRETELLAVFRLNSFDKNIERLIVIDSDRQISKLNDISATAFCTVSPTGETEYYTQVKEVSE